MTHRQQGLRMVVADDSVTRVEALAKRRLRSRCVTRFVSKITPKSSNASA
jgi:hypothetical protein